MVSIIICTYNQEEYIGDCIRSAIAQTYDDIELIISDDASPDNTFGCIMALKPEMEERFSALNIIHLETNGGLSKSLRNALEHAHGEWVKILYGDDMLTPNCIETCMEMIKKHPEYDMLHTAYYSCDDTSSLQHIIDNPGTILRPKETEVTPQSLFDYYFIITPTAFVKKDMYLSALDDSIGIDDWGTFLDIAIRGQIGYLDMPTVAFRIVKGSMSRFTVDEAGRNRFRRMFENECRVMDKYKVNPLINPNKGIINCCDQGVSIAIDLKSDELVHMVNSYAKSNGVSISFDMKLKYICSKIGVLKFIQQIKRTIGLETSSVFEAD